MLFHTPTPPCLVAISGVSATGKTTLITALTAHSSGVRVITHTTRPRRHNEPDTAYHFCSPAELRQLPDVLWINHHYGNDYAVTKTAVMEAVTQIGLGLLPTVTTNHQRLRSLLPEIHHIGIHLLAAPREELTKRMLAREESPETIDQRLKEIERIDQKALADPSLKCIPPSEAYTVFIKASSIIEKVLRSK